jgi:hypothetical protein
MMTPIIQKGGNTRRDVRILEGADLKKWTHGIRI